MAIVLAPLIVLAAIGLILSCIAHGCSLVGLPQPLGDATWGLHIGVFIVGLPAIAVSARLARGFEQQDVWEAVLRGCPSWMRWMTFVFVAYAILNFVTFAIAAAVGQQAPDAPAPPPVFRGFSGHWMAFYSGALAIVYSAIVVARSVLSRRCPNGHPVSSSAVFCHECGSQILDFSIDTHDTEPLHVTNQQRHERH